MKNSENEDDEFDNKENIIELPNEIMQAFYDKMTPEKQNRDLGLSPQSEKRCNTDKEGHAKSRKMRSMERLYMSPSPFQSPENLNSCYLTEKARSVRIPKKTLYVIDKVVRKKLRKDPFKHYENENNVQTLKKEELRQSLSPAPNEDNKNRTMNTGNILPLEKPTSLSYEEWCFLKETEKRYKEKLISNVKDEIQRNMIARKIKYFEEYEERKERMAKWEKDKYSQLKKTKREIREKKILDKEMKLRKQQFGEKAFKEWLRRSIEDLKIQKNKIREERRKKKEEEINKLRKDKQKKVMCEIAFKEWCDKKKQEDKHNKIKEANKVLSFEEKKSLYRKRNIEKSKETKYYGHYKSSQKRGKSSKRRLSKKKIDKNKI